MVCTYTGCRVQEEKNEDDMKGLRVWYKLPQVRAVRVYEVCVVH